MPVVSFGQVIRTFEIALDSAAALGRNPRKSASVMCYPILTLLKLRPNVISIKHNQLKYCTRFNSITRNFRIVLGLMY